MHILRGRMRSKVPVKWCLSEAHPHSLLLLAHSHTHTSKPVKEFVIWMCSHITIYICSLSLPLIPHYCSHGTFAVTEITKTGFLCIILFCSASWWWCNVKALSKCTQTLQKKCHHKPLQPCQGSSVNIYHLYTVRRRDVPGCTSLNIDSVRIVCFTFLNVTTFPSHFIVTCQL